MEAPVAHPSTFTITIVYNGVPKSVEHVNGHEQVTAVLQRALQAFDIRDRPHAYALYSMAGTEIPNDKTVEAAGVGPGSELLLREKIVGGG